MKKTFWEKRTIAWVILAACVLFSLTFSGGGALSNLRAEAEKVFYQGVNGDGLCIDRDLSARADSAYKLASVAAGYPGVDPALVEKVREASDNLSSAGDIPGKFQANLALGQSVEDLYSAMEKAELSKDDEAFAFKQYKEIQSRADTISRDFYNEKAAEFNKTLAGFPAGLVGALSGVKNLDLFEAN